MPKRTDIHKILVIGSGPIVMVRLLNLTTQVHRLVLLLEKRATRLCLSTLTLQLL